MSKMYYLSRKIQAEIGVGMRILCSGSFTEGDVKLLIVNLREYARNIGSVPRSGAGRYSILIKEFLDVADFIAHHNNDRGVIEERIRTHMQCLQEGFDRGDVDLAMVPFVDFINAHALVGGLVTLATSLLNAEPEDFVDVLTHQSDIALCIMSVLQDSYIALRNGEGVGVLQLRPYEGKYRIYCRVFLSKVSEKIQEKSGGRRITVAFPVMLSEAACIDEEISAWDHEALEQPVFDTYRDHACRLRVRPITP